MAYLLINEKVLDVGSLISTELDDLSDLRILLDGPVATEVLLEGLADALDV